MEIGGSDGTVNRFTNSPEANWRRPQSERSEGPSTWMCEPNPAPATNPYTKRKPLTNVRGFLFVYGLAGVWNLIRFTKSHGCNFEQRVALPEPKPASAQVYYVC